MKPKRAAKRVNFVSPNEKAKSAVVAQLVRIARKARLGYDDCLYNWQQARKKLGLRRAPKERRLPQLLAEADLKRFFRAIQDCGDVQHEILLKVLFYTAVPVSELVHIELGDIELDACKIFINRGKGQKCCRQHFWPYVLVKFMLRWFRNCLLSKHLLDIDCT
jgi:integrase